MRKNLSVLSLVLAFMLTLSACGSKAPAPVVGEEFTTYTNQGYTLSVPNEYTDLLLIDTTVTEGRGSTFFSVREKASAEAAKKLFPGENAGGGFLFGIGKLNEEDFNLALCGDMSGSEVFARDDNGSYYMYYHPTDVQLIREGDTTDADWAQWTELGQWAARVTDTFIAENEGLTPYYRTNTDLDIYLNRLARLDEDEFTLTRSGSDKTLVPSAELSRPWLEQLISGTFDHVDQEATPDCEYISLNLPDAQVRFDFFLTENGDANYIRQVWSDGMEALYLAIYEDGTLAGQTVLGWYITALQEQ